MIMRCLVTVTSGIEFEMRGVEGLFGMEFEMQQCCVPTTDKEIRSCSSVLCKEGINCYQLPN